MKPKNGAISLSLNFDDMFPGQKRSREGWNPDSISSFFALSPRFLSNFKLKLNFMERGKDKVDNFALQKFITCSTRDDLTVILTFLSKKDSRCIRLKSKGLRLLVNKDLGFYRYNVQKFGTSGAIYPFFFKTDMLS
ncbi:Uncharacterized protein Fot_32175 [Forsythia ovata]|uniref:Uncharacterized protein n=1 Tax=Forsythia ovata TaxID=205694 RepID=A0ABD1T719_9LAMI